MKHIKNKKENISKNPKNTKTEWHTNADMSGFFSTLQSINSQGISKIITKTEKAQDLVYENASRD